MSSINQPIKHTKKLMVDLGFHAQKASVKICQYFAHSGKVKFAAHRSCWCKEIKLWKFDPRCPGATADNVLLFFLFKNGPQTWPYDAIVSP